MQEGCVPNSFRRKVKLDYIHEKNFLQFIVKEEWTFDSVEYIEQSTCEKNCSRAIDIMGDRALLLVPYKNMQKKSLI